MGFLDIVSGKRYRENRLAALTCGEPMQRGRAAHSDTSHELKTCIASLANGVELTARYLLADKKYPAYEKIGRAADIRAVRFAAYTAWQFAPLLLKDGLVSLTHDDVFALARAMYPQDPAVVNAIERRRKNDNAGWTESEDAIQRYRFENMAIADQLLGLAEPKNMYEAVERSLLQSRCDIAGRSMLVRMLAEFLQHPEYLK